MTENDFIERGHKIGDLRVIFTICANPEVLGVEHENTPFTAQEAANEAVAGVCARLRLNGAFEAIDFDGNFSNWNGGRFSQQQEFCFDDRIYAECVRVADLLDDDGEAAGEEVTDWVPSLTAEEVQTIEGLANRGNA